MRKTQADIYAKNNLVAWCIVPFDAKKRGPRERAEMLTRLGINKLAYDYRAEHIPSFDAEIIEMKRAKIDIVAWWFPTSLNDEAKLILAKCKQHQLRLQLWVTGGGNPAKNPGEQAARIEAECKRLRPIREAAWSADCQLGLYNHGGWFGEPENLVAMCRALDVTKPVPTSSDKPKPGSPAKPGVGIVYNLHHAHHQMGQLAANLKLMMPNLITLNLNGMEVAGDQIGKKILPIGAGSLDRQWYETILKSGYIGPIGILNHTDLDAETRLKENLLGLDQLKSRTYGPLSCQTFGA